MLLNKEVTQVMSGIKYFHLLLFNGSHNDTFDNILQRKFSSTVYLPSKRMYSSYVLMFLVKRPKI